MRLGPDVLLVPSSLTHVEPHTTPYILRKQLHIQLLSADLEGGDIPISDISLSHSPEVLLVSYNTKKGGRFYKELRPRLKHATDVVVRKTR